MSRRPVSHQPEVVRPLIASAPPAEDEREERSDWLQFIGSALERIRQGSTAQATRFFGEGRRVTSQSWMPQPLSFGCPAGLEYLSQVDQLLVHQRIDALEIVSDWEVANTYAIKNTLGQNVYFASEESGTLHRQLWGRHRGFVMHITDNQNQEVMRMRRELKCCAGHCYCFADSESCSTEMSIESPVGEIIGYVRQRRSFCSPVLSILDANDTQVLLLEGPTITCQCPFLTRDIEFSIYANNGQEIGKISKQWSGFWQESFTTADNFSITFPLDLDVRVKATLLGALLLLDYMLFEQRPAKSSCKK